MSLKEKLQIILITYNRAKHAEHTLNALLAPNSPARELNILVLDNNSTDNTPVVVHTFQQQHPNVTYRKNNYNLGIAGNIARAMEIADQEYVWILGDDDVLHFEAWPDLEEAINQQKEVIIAANYIIPQGHEKDPVYLVWQLTFISACIYKTSLFTDTIMVNAFNNIYTLFPHLAPIIDYINNGKSQEMYLLPHALVSNGMQPETDISYLRGYKNDALYLKQRSMSWICGYANILVQLKDKKLIQHIMESPIHNEIHLGWIHFYYCMKIWYAENHNWLPIIETIRVLPWYRQLLCWLYCLSPVTFYRKGDWMYVKVFQLFKTKICPAPKRK